MLDIQPNKMGQFKGHIYAFPSDMTWVVANKEINLTVGTLVKKVFLNPLGLDMYIDIVCLL